MLGRRPRFCAFIGSGRSRIPGGGAEAGFDPGEILDASMRQRELSFKLGYWCLRGKDLVVCCHQLRFARSAGGFVSIVLKPDFR